jgi:membrane protease YdiL (CAAX protease family)
MTLLELLRKNRTAAFFVLAYGISWACWVPIALISNKVVLVDLPRPVMLSVIIAGIFGPSLAAVLLTYALEGKNSLSGLLKRLTQWHVKARWYLAALVLPLILGLASLGIFFLLGGPVTMPNLLDPMTLLLIFGTFFFQLILGGALGEEIGWRGFALPRLLSGYSALVATLILGGLWCLWHTPLFFIAGTGQSTMPFWIFIPGTFAFAFMFTWLYISTKGSLLIMLLLHAAINTTDSVLPIMSPLASGEWRPAALFIGIFIVAAMIILAYRPAVFLKRPEQEKIVVLPLMTDVSQK